MGNHRFIFLGCSLKRGHTPVAFLLKLEGKTERGGQSSGLEVS